MDPPSNAEHPCGALGIAHVKLLTHPHSFRQLSSQLASVLGYGPTSSSDIEAAWNLQVPAKAAAFALPGPRLILKSTENDNEERYVDEKGAGIYEVGFWVDTSKGDTISSPYGRIVWVPLDAK